MSTTNSGSGITRETYRRLVYGLVGLGIVGLAVGLVLDQPLAGTSAYLVGVWVGAAIAFGAPKWSDATLQDERDYERHDRASGLAMGVVMVLGIGLIPPLYLLDAGGHVVITETVGGLIAGASALYLLYGVCLGIVQRRTHA